MIDSCFLLIYHGETFNPGPWWRVWWAYCEVSIMEVNWTRYSADKITGWKMEINIPRCTSTVHSYKTIYSSFQLFRENINNKSKDKEMRSNFQEYTNIRRKNVWKTTPWDIIGKRNVYVLCSLKQRSGGCNIVLKDLMPENTHQKNTDQW